MGRRTYNENMHQEGSDTARHSDHIHERVPPLPIRDMSVGIEQEQEEGNEQLSTIISCVNSFMYGLIILWFLCFKVMHLELKLEALLI